MAVDGRDEPGAAAPPAAPATALSALARAASSLAGGQPPDGALSALAEAVAAGARAELVLVRSAGEGGPASVRAVASPSRALAAELHGARLPVDLIPREAVADMSALPEPVRRVAERVGAGSALLVPVAAGGRALGTLELFRQASPFDAEERAVAELASAQLALAHGGWSRNGGHGGTVEVLELTGDALLAGGEPVRAAGEVVRLAAEATGARAALLWRVDETGAGTLVATYGDVDVDGARPEELEPSVRAALSQPEAVTTLTLGGVAVIVVPLGRPRAAALQVVVTGDRLPPGLDRALAAFGGRAEAVLRGGERARTLVAELERTRTLLTVVAELNADLSLANTLGPVIDRLAELLGIERVAAYVREGNRLSAAASLGLDGGHVRVAERLLELVLGPAQGRGAIVVEDARRDARLAGVSAEAAEAGIVTAVAAPLAVPDGVIGLLALYPPPGRSLTEDEGTLLVALSAQLAAAMQNARLHERATRLGRELEEVLALERQAARQLRSLYEISHSFAETLSLATTVDAVARTVVELLGVDAGVIHMPDERGEQLVPRALHVADETAFEAVRAVLARPHALTRLPRRLVRARRPLALDAAAAGELGSGYELLVPFLDKGSTGVVVPVATAAEVLGTLTLLSLDPARPLTAETNQLALTVAAQAALAIDNARLYEQQKAFTDTMQRSLLPREQPTAPGLDVGAVYESSATVDVGGDVYDFVALDGGRLAVVLGDVMGHGIDAAADMAMAKFVFRSLAREHPEPAEFLAAANDVVCDEIASGKFITMAYLTADGGTGEIASASAGHPQPRVVRADGRVETLPVGGLALGIVHGQEYEDVRTELAPGDAVVVFTDGVVEARREGEVFGEERLERLLAERRGLPAGELARAVRDACRAFSGGALDDDCAIVVIARTGA